MALIHRATLAPTKLELLHGWLPGRPWFEGSVDVEQVGAYRFDDPAGDVGMEGFLLRADDGTVLHVPLTYRGAPLAGAEAHLVGTTEHSVLGRRWVYDACADPVWVTAAVATIVTGGTQAELLLDVGGRLEPLEPSMTVSGSGDATADATADATGVEVLGVRDDGRTTLVQTGSAELVVVRVVGTAVTAVATLTGRWAEGGSGVLAGLRHPGGVPGH